MATPAAMMTGRDFEDKCRRIARRRQCAVTANPMVGQTPWGTRHHPDAVVHFAKGTVGYARFKRKGLLVECKLQKVSGSAERKLFSEFETLRYTLEQQSSQYGAAWLVLDGKGWTPKLISYLQSYNSGRKAGPTGRRVQVLTAKEYSTRMKMLAEPV